MITLNSIFKVGVTIFTPKVFLLASSVFLLGNKSLLPALIFFLISITLISTICQIIYIFTSEVFSISLFHPNFYYSSLSFFKLCLEYLHNT